MYNGIQYRRWIPFCRTSWDKGIRAWVVNMLRSGLSPRGIVNAAALALTFSVFPFCVLPSLLCIGAGTLLGLNQPLMQVVNYLAAPLQIALFIPFMRLGEAVYGLTHFPLTVSTLKASLRLDAFTILGTIGTAVWHAIAGWTIGAPLLFVLAYAILHATLRLPALNRRIMAEASHAC